MPTIDAHHHFWKYNPNDYGWMDDSRQAIRRDFLPADLEAEIRAAGVDGAVPGQARRTIEGTRWLLDLAACHDFIRGVVGWIPLTGPRTEEVLAPLAHPKLKAVRHILQSEADENYMLRDDFNAGIAVLEQFGLAYDILIFERHLPQT